MIHMIIMILKQMSLALVKIGLGRIRNYSTQTSALWQVDQKILEEGLNEDKELKEVLRQNANLFFPLD